MAGTVKDLLRLAASQVGYSRWKDPQQGTKYGRWYAQYTGVPYFGANGVPYCAMFDSWCLVLSDVKCPCFPSAVAFDKRSDFEGRYVSRYDLKAGDMVAFDWDGDGKGDHVGVVEAVYNTHIQTIEGNTGDGEVLRRTRSYDVVICGVRPYYADSGHDVPSKLDVDSVWGRDTTSALQDTFVTPVDGEVWHQWLANRKPWCGTGWMWDISGEGSALIRAMQRWLRSKGQDVGEIDGIVGDKFWRGLMGAMGAKTGADAVATMQRKLNEGKLV